MDWKTIKETRGKRAREQGAILKDWGGRTSIGLIYPNAYGVGMSSLGFQAIYGLLNQYNNVVCERVFFEGHEPISLESERPLADFDVLAFSVSYEQDYFNVARLLKASGIPTLAAHRDERHPMVMAGGAAVTANPEPLSSLVDCLAIGEGEAILPDMVPILHEGAGGRRHELLQALSVLPGTYVPTFCHGRVTRRAALDIDDFTTSSVVLTPETELGDLYLMEIARGCGRACRFCLAGYQFRPMRYRSAGKLLEQARQGAAHRKRMGLVAAAVSDHPEIDELVTGLRRLGLEFSVSSLRVDPLSEAVLAGLAASGTRTVALAPEAGSERLRRIVHKRISADDVLSGVDRICAHGIKQIKLYFMIGLPTETPDDIAGIVDMALAARAVADKHRGKTQLTLNVTPFVPKAGTPFQWLPMAQANDLKERLSVLKISLSKKGIGVKADSIEWSLVQGMLSRGDARMGQVISDLPRVSLSAWQSALERAGIDADLIHRELPADQELPWCRIDSGISAQTLRAELDRALGPVPVG